MQKFREIDFGKIHAIFTEYCRSKRVENRHFKKYLVKSILYSSQCGKVGILLSRFLRKNWKKFRENETNPKLALFT